MQRRFNGRLVELLGGLNAPGGEHLVGVVMMMVVMLMLVLIVVMMMVAAVMVMLILVIIVMVMMLVLILVIVVIMMVMAAVMIVLVVIVMIMVLVLILVIIVVMVMAAVMVFLLVLFRKALHLHLRQLRRDGRLAFQRLDQLLARQVAPRGGYDGGNGIMLPQHGNGRVQLALGDGIGTGQDDGGGGLDLVVVELAEVLHIHLDLARVGHGHGVAQRDLVIRHLAHSGDDVGQLAHAGRLDQNTVGMVLGNDLLQRLAKIAHQRAADAAGVHLGDVDAGILQKAAVNADLAELVLDQHQLLPLVAFGDHLFDQGRLARAEEAGENINFCHKKHLLYKIL